MLAKAPIHATLPVVDLERARRFYEDKLGLKVLNAMAGGVLYEAGNGTRLLVCLRATPTKADNTAAGFEVRDLRSKGVAFEEYDLPGLKTVDGIASADGRRAAWFKDTEGNLLGLVQMEPAATAPQGACAGRGGGGLCLGVAVQAGPAPSLRGESRKQTTERQHCWSAGERLRQNSRDDGAANWLAWDLPPLFLLESGGIYLWPERTPGAVTAPRQQALCCKPLRT